VTAGNLVSGSPGSGTLLTSVVSTGEVYVYADVDESSLLAFNRLSREGRLAAEQSRVGVNMQLSDETDFSRRGYIESSDNHLDPATGSLTLRMVFPNPDGELVPGLYARVRLPVSAPGPALLISERAIGTDQSQKFVLTVAPDHTVGYRTVKLGPIIEGKRIIRSGVKAGEQVIVNGLQRVRPGMTVDPETAVAETEPAPRGASVAVK
jgi:RND family efflux transporter MFP subunit